MGGDDFVQSMVGAVEAAVGGEVQPSRVQQRPSAKGKYTSRTALAWAQPAGVSPELQHVHVHGVLHDAHICLLLIQG